MRTFLPFLVITPFLLTATSASSQANSTFPLVPETENSFLVTSDKDTDEGEIEVDADDADDWVRNEVNREGLSRANLPKAMTLSGEEGDTDEQLQVYLAQNSAFLQLSRNQGGVKREVFESYVSKHGNKRVA